MTHRSQPRPRYSLALLSTLLLIILSACSNNQIAGSAQLLQEAAAAAAKDTDLTPEQAILRTENKLLEATKSELAFYAPMHLRQAEDSLASAKQHLNASGSTNPVQVLTSAIAAENFIALAYTQRQEVETHLKDVLQQKDTLLALGSDKSMSTEYQRSLDDLKNLIALIESGKASKAIDKQPKLLSQMVLLEIETLIKIHLDVPREWLDKAEALNADSYAPASFEQATQRLKSSETLIRDHFRQRNEVEQAGKDALYAAKNAYFVGYESKRIVNLDKREAERQILNTYDMLNRPYRRLANEDLEPQKLLNAAHELVMRVDQLKTATTSATVHPNSINTAPAHTVENSKIAHQKIAIEPPETVRANTSQTFISTSSAEIEAVEMEDIDTENETRHN